MNRVGAVPSGESPAGWAGQVVCAAAASGAIAALPPPIARASAKARASTAARGRPDDARVRARVFGSRHQVVFGAAVVLPWRSVLPDERPCLQASRRTSRTRAARCSSGQAARRRFASSPYASIATARSASGVSSPRRVADALERRREDHRHGDLPRHLGRVVQGAAGHPDRLAGHLREAGLGQVHQLGVEGDRLDPPDGLLLELAAAAPGLALRRVDDRLEHRRERARLGVADVDRHLGGAGDHGDRPGLELHDPAGADPAGLGGRDLLDPERRGRGREPRVAARVHRGRAGVRGAAR